MKTRHSLLLCFLLTTAALSAQTPNLEFNGVLIANGTTQVALLNLATDHAAWVGLGNTFAGYTVASFQPGVVNPVTGESTPDTVVLTKAGTNRPLTLRLKVAGIQTAPNSDPSADSNTGGIGDPFATD